MRRRRRAERGVVEGLQDWAPSQKKISYCSQNKFGCILTQFLTSKNTDSHYRRLVTRILRFNRETKLTKTAQKIMQELTVRPGGGRSHHRPPLNTPLFPSLPCP